MSCKQLCLDKTCLRKANAFWVRDNNLFNSQDASLKDNHD